MSSNPDCPKSKWICITICSQGNECITCEHYPKPDEDEDTPNRDAPRGWINTAKAASKARNAPGSVSEGGEAVIHGMNNSLNTLYISSVYVDDNVMADMEPLYMAQYPVASRKDHQAHALVYTAVWQEDWA